METRLKDLKGGSQQGLCTDAQAAEVLRGNAARYLTTWLVALPETLCLFPVYRARAVYEHQTFFSFHTQNREETISEFDKKGFAL